MNWKNRLTNYNFWISIFSAVLLILQALKIEFDIAYVNEIFTAVLGLLVVIGIISDPTRTTMKNAENSTKSQQQETKKVEEVIPTNKENEINNDNLKNNLQAVIEKLSIEFENKIKDLENLNSKIFNNVNNEQTIQNKVESEINQCVEEVLPAVAETDNPYIDVIN